MNGQFIIPFPELSDEFFFKRGRLVSTNRKRDQKRSTRETSTENGCQVAKFPADFSENSCSFKNALSHLNEKLKSSTEHKTVSIKGCIAVLTYMQEKSLVVAFGELTKIYQIEVGNHLNKETSQARMAPSELQERFRDNQIHLTLFYMYGKAYAIFPESKSISGIIHQIEKMLPADVLVNQTLEAKIGNVFKTALEMLTSKIDRDIVKSLFATATSAKFTAKLQGIRISI